MSTMISCPDCLAVWTIEEIEDQMCGCCGYPNNENNDVDFDDEPDLMGPTRSELIDREREQMVEWQKLK